MKLGDGPHPLGPHQEVVSGLDHLAGSVTEHHRFHIVPSSGDGVHAIVLPDGEEEFVLVVFFSEADEDRLWISRDLPAAETAWDLLDGAGLPDPFPALLVRFLEIGVGLEVGPRRCNVPHRPGWPR
jgi:hypothetical protein